MSSARGLSIGIDLGTTYSRVSGDHCQRPGQQDHSQPRPLHTKRLIGAAAKSPVPMNPTNTTFDVKQLIGRKCNDAVVQSDMKLAFQGDQR